MGTDQDHIVCVAPATGETIERIVVTPREGTVTAAVTYSAEGQRRFLDEVKRAEA